MSSNKLAPLDTPRRREYRRRRARLTLERDLARLAATASKGVLREAVRRCLSDNPAMPLPQAVRRLAPDRLRYSVRLRALAVGSGLVPPRSMHSAAESELLAALARGRRMAVEIGVYEGSSAVVLAGALPAGAGLHLND